MILTIGWMYHDIMNLYGDKGNIMVLKKRCEDRGIDVRISYCDIGDDVDLSAMDLVFFGGGADKEQSSLMRDLLSRKENIQKALDAGVMFLLICGGYQLFGQYYIDANGNRIDALGIFDYYTVSGKSEERCIGNIAVRCELEGQSMTLVGFENHGGQTYDVATPLGDVLFGHGNTAQKKQEGFYNGQVIGTYLHGPLLPRNPEFADFVIMKSLRKSYGEQCLEPLPDDMELAAKNIMLKRMELL